MHAFFWQSNFDPIVSTGRGGGSGRRKKRGFSDWTPQEILDPKKFKPDPRQQELQNSLDEQRRIEEDLRIQKLEEAKLIEQTAQDHERIIKERDDSLLEVMTPEFLRSLPSPLLSEEMRRIQRQLDEKKKTNRIKMARLRAKRKKN
jgi:hypothetical protein